MRYAAIVLSLVCGCSGSSVPAGGGSPGGGGGGSPGGPLPSGGGVVMNGDSAVVNMTSFTLPAGSEAFKCQSFANPFGGADAEIAGWEAHMASGSHHMLFLYDDKNADAPLADCSGLTFGEMAFGAQKTDSSVTYPDGVAALVKGARGFRLVSHYLNATTHDITATVQIVIHKAAAGSVTQHAGVFFLNNISGVVIPAMTDRTIMASWTVPHDLFIVNATGHMHMRTQNLTATADGSMLYQTDSWDNAPLQVYSPPQALKAGSTVSWSCTIHNDTANLLTFGESAQTNEMCIFDGQYYPVADPNSPNLEQQR